MHLSPAGSDDDPGSISPSTIEALVISCPLLREVTLSKAELGVDTLLAFSTFPALQALQLPDVWGTSVQEVSKFLTVWHRDLQPIDPTKSYSLGCGPPLPNLLPQESYRVLESSRLEANKSVRPILSLGYLEDIIEEMESGDSPCLEGDVGTRTWLDGMKKLRARYADTIELELFV
jgi:hypothetical protein